MIPKSVLKKMKVSLMGKSLGQLEELLSQQEKQLIQDEINQRTKNRFLLILMY